MCSKDSHRSFVRLIMLIARGPRVWISGSATLLAGGSMVLWESSRTWRVERPLMVPVLRKVRKTAVRKDRCREADPHLGNIDRAVVPCRRLCSAV